MVGFSAADIKFRQSCNLENRALMVDFQAADIKFRQKFPLLF
jgi:hypothetical protein